MNAPSGPVLALEMEPGRVLRVLLATTALLVALSDALQCLYHLGPQFPLRDFFVFVLSVNEEKSVPTVFNFLLHVLSAILVLAVTVLQRRAVGRYPWRWVLLFLIFVYTASDEILALHERIGTRLHEQMHTTGALFYAWVIPGAGFVLLVTLLELRLVLDLPTPIRRLAVASACIFVGGALGVESLESLEASGRALNTLRWELLGGFEEGMEMAGLSLFIYAMLRYVREHLGGLALTLPAVNART
jgi:hypothetical protein